MSNEEKSGLKHWVPAFVLMVCVVLAFFDKISIAVLFSDPHFQSSMGIAEDKAKLGWLMTSFLLAYGFSSVFLSFLGDIFNPKKMLFWSVTLVWQKVRYLLWHTPLLNRLTQTVSRHVPQPCSYWVHRLVHSLVSRSLQMF